MPPPWPALHPSSRMQMLLYFSSDNFFVKLTFHSQWIPISSDLINILIVVELRWICNIILRLYHINLTSLTWLFHSLIRLYTSRFQVKACFNLSVIKFETFTLVSDFLSYMQNQVALLGRLAIKIQFHPIVVYCCHKKSLSSIL